MRTADAVFPRTGAAPVPNDSTLPNGQKALFHNGQEEGARSMKKR